MTVRGIAFWIQMEMAWRAPHELLGAMPGRLPPQAEDETLSQMKVMLEAGRCVRDAADVGAGRCVRGQCVCEPGFTGVACSHASGHRAGVCCSAMVAASVLVEDNV